MWKNRGDDQFRADGDIIRHVQGGCRFVCQLGLSVMTIAVTERQQCPLVERRRKHLSSSMERLDGISVLFLGLKSLATKQFRDWREWSRVGNAIQFCQGVIRKSQLKISLGGSQPSNDNLRI